MVKKYDVIYSLGRDCACSKYMKKAKLRICSGPFDWLKNASFERRLECMLNDFDGFFNFEDFKPLEKNKNLDVDKHCDYYANVKSQFYFLHDFQEGLPLSETFQGVKDKYERRIKRFYKKIADNKKVLLIWFSHINGTSDEVLLDLCGKFCDKMNKQIDFLIIEHQEGQFEAKQHKLSDNIIKYSCHSQENDADVTLLGNEKLILPIFKQYKLIIPWYVYVKNFMIKFLIKTLSLFIPSKKWRRKLRNFCKS